MVPMTITRGRGAWFFYGMPDNTHDGLGDTASYNLRRPLVPAVHQCGQDGVAADPSGGSWVQPDKDDPFPVPSLPTSEYTDQERFDFFAVSQGVRQIQQRIARMGFTMVPVTGIFDPATSWAVVWAQTKLGVRPDGDCGPTTARHLFWPAVCAAARSIAPKHDPALLASLVGGIAQHESGWDPGAVGSSTPSDLGIVQINGPANATLTAAQRFDFRAAFTYAAQRLDQALSSGYTVAEAVCSYGYPAVAKWWHEHGTMDYPANAALAIIAQRYVAFVTNWFASPLGLPYDSLGQPYE